MGLFSRINRAWSQADFWDKEENKRQRQQFAAEDRKKKREQEQQARVVNGPSVRDPQSNLPDRPSFDFNSLKTPVKTSVRVPTLQEYDAQALDSAGVKKPQQSLLNKVRDQFDANTEADKYRRAQEQTRKTREQLTSQGVNEQKARETGARVARANINTPYRSGIDNIRDFPKDLTTNAVKMAADIAVGIGRGTKAITANPVESLREDIARQTNNPEAERAARYRNNVNLFGKEKADRIARGEALKPTDLIEPVGNVVSVAPAALGAGIAVKGAKEALATRTLAPLLKGGLAGLDEALLGVRSLFRRPQAREDLGALGRDAVETSGAVVPGQVPNVLNEADIADLLTTNIPVRQPNPINVVDTGAEAVSIPARNTTPQGQIIRELGGDAPNVTRIPTPQEVAEQQAARRFAEQDFGMPDSAIEGVTPRSNEPYRLNEADVAANQDQIIGDYSNLIRGLGEGNGVDILPDGTRATNNFRDPTLKGKNMSKADWRKEAERQLREGKAPEDIQKAFGETNDPEIQSLLNEQPNLTNPRSITVKEEKSIPVQDKTEIPTNTPSNPGTVRVTTKSDPMAARTEAIANQPVVAPIPKVGTTLSDGRKVTQNMVNVQKEQRRLARKLEKQTQATNESLDRVTQERGERAIIGDEPKPNYANTGKVAQGKRGNVYETRNREQGLDQARQATNDVSIKEFVDKNSHKELWDDDTMLEAEAILQRENVHANPDELRVLSKKVDEQASRKGGDLALLERTRRTTDSADTISNRFVRKFYGKTENGSLTDDHLNKVKSANRAFTKARDKADRLYELAMDSPTKANVKAYEQALNDAERANKVAKHTELVVAKQAAKGDKSKNAAEYLRKLEEETDVPNFDYVNANNLSGTGTMTRNAINSGLVAAERLDIKGSNLRGLSRGVKEGWNNWLEDIKLRTKQGGKNPINWVKNWTTLGNTLGDISLRASARGDAEKYYRAQLKAQGYEGEELANKTRLLTAKDPDNMREEFFRQQLQQVGLTSLTHGGKGRFKLENALADSMSEQVGNVPIARNLSKGLINTLFGYPTIAVRSGVLGVNRAMLGVNNLLRAAGTAKFGSNAEARVALRQASKDLKGGTIAGGLGLVLYNDDRLSFGFPDDKDERKQWKDERKTEYSIKIGDSWYPIPSLLGPFSIPLMAPGVALDALKNGGDKGDVAEALAKMVVDSSTPVDDLGDIAKALNGEETGNWWAQKAASLASSQIPASALLRQLARITDSTVREADKKADGLVQIYQNIVKGIPGLTSQAIAKLDSQGNEFKHPNLLETLLGASTKEQKAGVQQSKETQGNIDSTVKTLKDTGALDDKNIAEILDDDAKSLYQKAKNGKKLDESEIKTLKKGLTKGVSEKDGYTTAYLEKDQIDSHLTALKLKKSLMEADKSTKPSNIKDIDVAITRGEIYKENKIPYELIQAYKETELKEWRAMGDPDSEDHNKKMYDQLANLDALMTDKEVSFKKGNSKKNKYDTKESLAKNGGSGRGGGKGRMGTTDFGTINSLGTGPKVKEYASISTSSGSVPVIGVKRPNIVKKISVSR